MDRRKTAAEPRHAASDRRREGARASRALPWPDGLVPPAKGVQARASRLATARVAKAESLCGQRQPATSLRANTAPAPPPSLRPPPAARAGERSRRRWPRCGTWWEEPLP